MRGKAQIDVPFQVNRRFGHEVSPEFQEPANIGLGSQSFSQHDFSKRMEIQFEFRHHSEVTAASSQSPKQIWIFFCVGADDGTIRSNKSKTFDVVA